MALDVDLDRLSEALESLDSVSPVETEARAVFPWLDRYGFELSDLVPCYRKYLDWAKDVDHPYFVARHNEKLQMIYPALVFLSGQLA